MRPGLRGDDSHPRTLVAESEKDHLQKKVPHDPGRPHTDRQTTPLTGVPGHRETRTPDTPRETPFADEETTI